MSAIDRLVEWFSPTAGVRRRVARMALASYEAAEPTRLRKFRRDNQSPNHAVQKGAHAVRVQARYLEKNHDLARGVIRTLVNNTVGPGGLGIEPQPRTVDGEIHADYAAALREAWFDWQRHPEVTRRYSWPKAQRLIARTWFRDGEAFAQQLVGPVALLDHGTAVPYSLELIEPDLVPLDHDDEARRIRQGVERNAWGRPLAYWVYREHPSDSYRLVTISDLKRVPAERMLHVATLDRIGQIRGVSELASVLTRLEDIRDYEESERVAAKIAAMLTAYVKKGTPDMYDSAAIAALTSDTDGTKLPRELGLQAGTIIDGLAVGEEIGLLDSKRPNLNLVTFRQGQLRAVAAGVGASYSSIARDYSGTYSSQRQELVEQWVHYATLTDEFAGQFVRPVWESFVQAAHLSGVVPIPAEVNPRMADDALFVGQSMPWIDPAKEALAWETLVRAGFASEVEVMRRRGVNPRDVLAQIAEFRRETGERGLVFTSDAANDGSGASEALQTMTAEPEEPAAPDAPPMPSDDELQAAVRRVLDRARGSAPRTRRRVLTQRDDGSIEITEERDE